ncbi:MAG: hypothetical protein ACI9U2_004337 [Bradymonadia bacterium]|jgi:hypothetical protein
MRTSRTWQKGGAISLIVVQLCVIFMLFLAAGVFISDWSIRREQQQNQADAITVAAMQIARTQGINAVCEHPAMQVLMDANGPREAALEDCGSFVEVEQPDGTTQLQFVANTSSSLNDAMAASPFNTPMLRLDNNYTLRTEGTSGMAQQVFDQAEENLPQFVLVLDFSGSMQIDFGGQRRYQVLQQVVTNMLNRDLPIHYGLVNYSSDVLDTVAIGPDNIAQIVNTVNGRGPSGMTNYQAAVDRATQLLQATGSERMNMLFISDGEPTAGGDPVDAADRARNAGVQIITLNVGGGPGQADLLKDMGGRIDPPEDYANPRFYFSAANPAALQEAFDAIVDNAVCTIGPVDVELAPEDDPSDSVFAVLKNARDEEVAMAYEANLTTGDMPDTLSYNFDPADRMVRLTEAACEEILDNGARVVVRHGDLNLVQ